MLRWLWILLLALAWPAQATNISSLPFSCSAGGTYVVTGNLSHDGTGASAAAITVPAGAGCSIDLGGFTITLTGTATNGISISTSSGSTTVFNGTIDKQNNTVGSCIVSGANGLFTAHHVKCFSSNTTTGAANAVIRMQGNGNAIEECLLVRSATNQMTCAVGNVTSVTIINCTMVHTGTGESINAALTGSNTLTLKNNVFVSGTPTPGCLNATVATWTGLTASNNVWYRTNTGRVATYGLSGTLTGYDNTGGTHNINELDANETHANPNLANNDLTISGNYSIQSTSSAALDNGTSGYGQSTDLAGNARVANGTVDRGAYELQDTTAPSAVADLACGTATATTMPLTWTAPGDDAGTGTATTYDVRYSTSTINEGNFSSATAATGEPSPGAAGHAETFTVTGLSAATTYYFAVKTSDEVPNTSAISNVVSKATASGMLRAAGTVGIDFLEGEDE